MLSEFTRVQWASEKAKVVWEPRIQAIQEAWLDVELRSVVTGVRRTALIFGADAVKASGLPAVRVADNRFAVGDLSPHLAGVYAAHDDRAIGALLGFPACCIDFFDHVWNAEQKRDTSLAMDGRDGPPECNILGRWLGVRLIPHLPCAFDCHETRQLAERLKPLWPTQELAWAEEILSWPVEYSALHGIAIVTFPVVRVVTSTDYTPTLRLIRREGTRYPVEAPHGARFPFRRAA